MRTLALLALLLAAPLSAQDRATVEINAPPAQVNVSHANADTTVVLIDVTVAQAALDTQIAAVNERGWVNRVVDPLVDNWPWIGLGVAALIVFHKKDFGGTVNVEDGDVTQNQWPQIDRRKDHGHGKHHD